MIIVFSCMSGDVEFKPFENDCLEMQRPCDAQNDVICRKSF